MTRLIALILTIILLVVTTHTSKPPVKHAEAQSFNAIVAPAEAPQAPPVAEAAPSPTPAPTPPPAAPQAPKPTPVTAPRPIAKPSLPGNCEQYRPLLSNYSWNVEIAMLVMSKESGCNPNAVSRTNDHGLFQLNNQPVYDPAANIAIAYAKYAGGRVGANNWSAWYAVCTTGNSPQPKYAGVHCL